jgi:hypothetical protein
MATTLPTFNRTIDNDFTQTWYDIKPKAIDQILEATVIWALMKMKGMFKPQEGGRLIEETVRYALPPTKAVRKGSILNQGEYENRTAAFWTFRYLSAHVQRSLDDDLANRGRYRIADYVAQRTEDAMDALVQQYETNVLRSEQTDESGDEIQGFNDIVPAYANRATGTFGRISRANTWWQPKYKQWTAPKEINLLSDMKEFYNTVGNNQSNPDIIITDKTTFEMYEDFGLDAVQISGNSKILDLGFETLRFKGKDLIWTPNITAGDMLMLNSRYIKFVYDPACWFDMTEWKTPELQMERIAHILCRGNMTSSSLRRHGRLYT